jgi:hypothetical protein
MKRLRTAMVALQPSGGVGGWPGYASRSISIVWLLEEIGVPYET